MESEKRWGRKRRTEAPHAVWLCTRPSEVGPKCKAANLIWRLTEGGVASSPVASCGPLRHADSRQLYIINSHKYANRPTVAVAFAGGAAIAAVAPQASPTRICSFAFWASARKQTRDHERETVSLYLDTTTSVWTRTKHHGVSPQSPLLFFSPS